MQEQIDLVGATEEPPKAGGLSLSVIVSLVLHSAFIIWFLQSRPETAPVQKNAPMTRYVELMQQNDEEVPHVEAPGPAVDHKPLRAPTSDANRRASMPEPTGLTPTKRPGDDSGLYQPRISDPSPVQQPRQQSHVTQQPQPSQQGLPPGVTKTTELAPQHTVPTDTFIYREPSKASAVAAAQIDWRSAIREVKGPIGGGDGPDFGDNAGGERGLAEQGPISFETAWYDWGPYAQSMVSRIRVNWYANMPQLIRTGIGGVVTIRFTIQRDGRITEVVVLKSSGHPPYDFAARKAIELSSPLNPLPADFPNSNERVTAMFYYNTKMPS